MTMPDGSCRAKSRDVFPSDPLPEHVPARKHTRKHRIARSKGRHVSCGGRRFESNLVHPWKSTGRFGWCFGSPMPIRKGESPDCFNTLSEVEVGGELEGARLVSLGGDLAEGACTRSGSVAERDGGVGVGEDGVVPGVEAVAFNLKIHALVEFDDLADSGVDVLGAGIVEHERMGAGRIAQ